MSMYKCLCRNRFSILLKLLGEELLGHMAITGIPRFIVLHRNCVFNKLKVCGNSALNKSISAILLITFAHFVSLCHILVILTIFQTFSLLFDLLW